MRIYEELFIVDPNATEEDVEAVSTQVQGVIKDAGGTVEKVDKWGKRRLAYRVKKREEGFYILIQFTAGPEIVKEIERRLRVHDLVLKYITVRIDEKLKWLEKRKKAREKRAQKKPAVQAGLGLGPGPGPAPAPGAAPGPRMPGEPVEMEEEAVPEGEM